MSEKKSAAERIIDKFQGSARLAKELGIHRSTPSGWVTRGKGHIPPEYHRPILDRARALNIHIEPVDLLNV